MNWPARGMRASPCVDEASQWIHCGSRANEHFPYNKGGGGPRTCMPAHHGRWRSAPGALGNGSARSRHEQPFADVSFGVAGLSWTQSLAGAGFDDRREDLAQRSWVRSADRRRATWIESEVGSALHNLRIRGRRASYAGTSTSEVPTSAVATAEVPLGPRQNRHAVCHFRTRQAADHRGAPHHSWPRRHLNRQRGSTCQRAGCCQRDERRCKEFHFRSVALRARCAKALQQNGMRPNARSQVQGHLSGVVLGGRTASMWKSQSDPFRLSRDDSSRAVHRHVR